MLSRFERGQRLPVAARLPALLWIVFFYSLNIPKMVDFRGFKHPDVPEGGRGGVSLSDAVDVATLMSTASPESAAPTTVSQGGERKLTSRRHRLHRTFCKTVSHRTPSVSDSGCPRRRNSLRFHFSRLAGGKHRQPEEGRNHNLTARPPTR
ncbi:hypothetical protein ACOMHN_002762 [Nucella lapillus]